MFSDSAVGRPKKSVTINLPDPPKFSKEKEQQDEEKQKDGKEQMEDGPKPPNSTYQDTWRQQYKKCKKNFQNQFSISNLFIIF